MTFITRILIHLSEVQEKNDNASGDLDINELIREIQYFLVRDLESQKVGIGTVPFSKEEIKDLTKKVNKVVDALDKIQTGQEVIYDRIEELKEDYKELLTSFGLGKKPFLQRFAGITAAFVAEKGVDEIYKQIEPIVKEVFNNSPKLIS